MPILGMILAGVLATAQADTAIATPAPTTAPAAKAAKPKLVCVTEAVTGAIIPKRSCRTAEEWEQRKQIDARNVQDFKNQTGITVCGGNTAC